jgi:hypothetical protein
MSILPPRRWGVCAALAFGIAPLMVTLAGPPAKPIKNEYFKGKVMPLSEVMEKLAAKLDTDASPYWLALASDDGKFYPLIKDDGARMFFKDSRLLNRPMRLTGRLLPGTQLLQVVEVHSYNKGELQEVYYWCDICSIKRYEKKNCDCCGGAMVLREEPLNK